MAIVKEVITHILLHVDAESKDVDESQVAGVEKRAQYVRDVLSGLTEDTSQKELSEILQLISKASSTDTKQESFKKTLDFILTDAGVKPQSAIQTWVGKGLENG